MQPPGPRPARQLVGLCGLAVPPCALVRAPASQGGGGRECGVDGVLCVPPLMRPPGGKPHSVGAWGPVVCGPGQKAIFSYL